MLNQKIYHFKLKLNKMNSELETKQMIKIKIMKFTKIENGQYEFRGIDNWNGETIWGKIINDPYDVLLRQQWQVVFTYSDHCDVAFFGPTLNSCKKWLTNPAI
mgnify:CR=1 FL=1